MLVSLKGEFFMKAMIASMTLVLGLSSMAATVEEADSLFSKRGEDAKNALEAGNQYKALAASETDAQTKAQLKVKEATAVYYYGNLVSGRSQKMSLFERSYNAAKAAQGLLSKSWAAPKKPEFKGDLAEAHYAYAASLGKYAEAKGVLASLSRWKELKGHLNAIDSLEKGQDDRVRDWGSYRVRGRAMQKHPTESSTTGLKYLKLAYDNTINEDFGTSRNSTNTLYYLDVLRVKKQWSTFCEVYENFTEVLELEDEELQELNPKLVPEMKNDIKDFKAGKGYLEKVKSAFNSKC
jgi:hypothetical protein